MTSTPDGSSLREWFFSVIMHWVNSSVEVGLLILALVTPCTAAQTAQAKHPKPAGSPYAHEETQQASPDLATKEKQLRAALAKDPGSALAHYDLALVLRQEGKYHESLDAYTQAAALRRPTSEDLRLVALDYVLLNDYDDAIHWLETAVRMDPTNARVLYSLGRCYFSRDRYQDAARAFEQVMRVDPKNLKAEENLGLTYDALNRPEEAEKALRTAAEWADKAGKDEWPFLDFGGFLLDHGRAAEAIDPLRSAAQIQPDCAKCHERLGRALVNTKELHGGIAELQRATALEPNDPKAHYELGRALRQVGQADMAQQEFAISQKLYSNHSQE